MQITLKVPNKKAKSFLDVLRHISYVKIKPSDVAQKQSSKKSAEEFYDGLRRSVHELNEVLAGRKQARPIEELLAELQSSDDH